MKVTDPITVAKAIDANVNAPVIVCGLILIAESPTGSIDKD